jgi:hypothetical protein
MVLTPLLLFIDYRYHLPDERAMTGGPKNMTVRYIARGSQEAAWR